MKYKLNDRVIVEYKNYRPGEKIESIITATRVTKTRQSNPDDLRNCHLRKYYGISLNEYNKMFEAQNGCCGMCGKHQTEFKQRLAVDHDHLTGKIRMLLCIKCNVSLGHYEKIKELAEKYLLQYKVIEGT